MNGKAQATLRTCEHQSRICDLSRLNRSIVSKQGADDLGMDDADVVAVIQAPVFGDFEKSMTSVVDHRIWQDVYRPRVGGRELYVKFTLDAQGVLFLISFKEA